MPGGQPAAQEGVDLLEHLDDFRLRHQVFADRCVASGERPQLADVVRVRQHADIEDIVGIERHAADLAQVPGGGFLQDIAAGLLLVSPHGHHHPGGMAVLRFHRGG